MIVIQLIYIRAYVVEGLTFYSVYSHLNHFF